MRQHGEMRQEDLFDKRMRKRGMHECARQFMPDALIECIPIHL